MDLNKNKKSEVKINEYILNSNHHEDLLKDIIYQNSDISWEFKKSRMEILKQVCIDEDIRLIKELIKNGNYKERVEAYNNCVLPYSKYDELIELCEKIISWSEEICNSEDEIKKINEILEYLNILKNQKQTIINSEIFKELSSMGKIRIEYSVNQSDSNISNLARNLLSKLSNINGSYFDLGPIEKELMEDINCENIKEYIDCVIEDSRGIIQSLEKNNENVNKRIELLQNSIKLLIKYTKDGKTYVYSDNNFFKDKDEVFIEKHIKETISPFKSIFFRPSTKHFNQLYHLRCDIGSELNRLINDRVDIMKNVIWDLNSAYSKTYEPLYKIFLSHKESIDSRYTAIERNIEKIKSILELYYEKMSSCRYNAYDRSFIDNFDLSDDSFINIDNIKRIVSIKYEEFKNKEVDKIYNKFEEIIDSIKPELKVIENRIVNKNKLEEIIPIQLICNPLVNGFKKDYELTKISTEIINNIASKYKIQRECLLSICLSKPFSIFFEKEDIDIINRIIKQMICETPAGLSENILIDMSYAGKYYTDYNDIRKVNEKIIGKKIYTNRDEVNEILDILLDEVIYITQNKISNKYNNIYEYNLDNDNKIPFKIVSILGFPNLFDSNMINKLISLLKNGPSCGINLFIQYDENNQYDIKEEVLSDIKNNCLVFKYSKFYDLLVKGKEISYENGIANSMIEVAQNITDMKNKSLKFDTLMNKVEKMNSAKELSIPIGKNDNGDIQNLIFGRGVSHHGLIAGQTGSGKSTLLHTIILSGIKNYTPDDLNIYLIDFKEGIEFKIYSKYRIPHIKLIGLESQVEFGESILEFMVKELQRRAKIFKSNEVENLRAYREKTGKSIPRILLIIDEFTILFNRKEDRDITLNNAQLMKKIINQGRAFGINVLMASQTIKDTLDSTLTDEVIEQMAIRIGLKCTPKDASALMGSSNTAISTLENEIGRAIYNPENGRGENSKFKIVYINSDERDSILKDVESEYLEDYSDYECRVFDGNSSVNIENDNNSMFNSSNINISKYAEKAWIGEPIKIGNPIEIRFEQGINNACIISNDNKYSNRILTYFILSIIKQKRLGDKKDINKSIRFIDYNHDIFEECNILSNIIEENSDIIQSSNLNRPKSIIDELYDEYKVRRDNDIYRCEYKYLIINGLQRARDILIKSGDTNKETLKDLNNISVNIKEDGRLNLRGTRHTEYKETNSLSTSEKFKELLKEGGEFGIFIIITCDNFKNYMRTSEKIGYRLNDLFNIRIAFNMNSKDGDKFIGVPNTDALNENTAIIYDDILGTRNKFIVYSEPTEDWVRRII